MPPVMVEPVRRFSVPMVPPLTMAVGPEMTPELLNVVMTPPLLIANRVPALIVPVLLSVVMTFPLD